MLILREVLHWHADEVAELLDTTVASVNSALQRARATLGSRDLDASTRPPPLDEAQQALLDRYVRAFEDYDMDALTSLLHEDAELVHAAVRPVAPDPRRHREVVPRPRKRLPRFEADPDRGRTACPPSASTSPIPNGGRAPWSLQVVELDGDRIKAITFFLDTERFFPLFGLPAHVD